MPSKNEKSPREHLNVAIMPEECQQHDCAEVFAMSFSAPAKTGQVTISLPFAWARHYEGVKIVLRNLEMFGLQAHIEDPSGRVLASYPWWDHLEETWDRYMPNGHPPMGTAKSPWSDLDEGWYQAVLAHDGRVYVFQGNLDGFTDFTAQTPITQGDDDSVHIGDEGGVWWSADERAYLEAWAEARTAALGARPES